MKPEGKARVTLVPASRPMPLDVFKTALLKRRCVALGQRSAARARVCAR
jgi:hypothetical protein